MDGREEGGAKREEGGGRREERERERGGVKGLYNTSRSRSTRAAQKHNLYLMNRDLTNFFFHEVHQHEINILMCFDYICLLILLSLIYFFFVGFCFNFWYAD